MFRRYAWAALALAAAACSSDSSGGDSTPTDAATPTDSSTPIPVVNQASTETGKACTADDMCGGMKADCLSALGGGQLLPAIEFEGGYCSAQCTEDSECNPAGDNSKAGCPGGSAIKMAKDQLGAAASFILPMIQSISVCLQKCDADAGTSQCREGYVCQSLQKRLSSAVAMGAGDAGAGGGAAGGFNVSGLIASAVGPGNFCLPEEAPPAMDAGTPTDGGGLDAGM